MRKYLMEVDRFIAIDTYDPDAWEKCKYGFDTESKMVDFIKNELGFFDEIRGIYKLEKIDPKKYNN